MTNEQTWTQRRALGKGDTQPIRVALTERSAQQPAAATVEPAEPPYQPPCEPAKRQQFWLDTCRGVAHLHLGCVQVQELYRKHGCRFAEPTSEQVGGILGALDSAMPRWETEHPELFYQTLELSFPELLIRR